MTEADLLALGIHRVPVPLPFPQAGGPVNVYLVEDEGGGIVLVDSGLGSPEAEAVLLDGLGRAGRSPEEVRRILVTHGHVDHYGGARGLEELAGHAVPALVHAADLPKVAETGPRWTALAAHYGAHLARLGVPEAALAVAGREAERGFSLARRIREVRPTLPGERLRTRHLDLEVLHMPGHTPGLLCLYDRAHRLLFSSDHLLERVSPNPLIELGPDGRDGYFRPLVEYLQSMERTRALEVELVLPGHGPPFTGHRAVADSLHSFYARRQERLLGQLRRGPRTPWELVRALFREPRPGDVFLAISEVAANLELMEERGVVAREERDGVRRYHPAR
ncbi:MAG TPA: MBL fold metallo-hydrolase [Anaeromyxobacter sp.]|nr:MBL fold metallo-hydrolase [Anaeromyxobacter sp.]